MEEEANINLLRQGNISLILDSYDDIFSDFDPRPYSHRALSDDFLNECKKASVGKETDIEIRFLVPRNRRNAKNESQIRKRLKEHFTKHMRIKHAEMQEMKKDGYRWVVIGSLLLFTAALILDTHGYFSRLLLVIMEPAGWFTMWTGLDKIFSEAKKPEYKFYKKMAEAKIGFHSC